MTEEIADFLRSCVEAKLNIVVSGGTGSGKTTLLNALAAVKLAIGDLDRVFATVQGRGEWSVSPAPTPTVWPLAA